ncbi:MAG: hypothetical protein LAT81_11385 [Oceanicaulis sp.]|nr:hypothetical protein [Oceanicaulis sp.]
MVQKLYIARWIDDSIALVMASSKENAMGRIDEFADPTTAQISQMNDLVLDFGKRNDPVIDKSSKMSHMKKSLLDTISTAKKIFPLSQMDEWLSCYSHDGSLQTVIRDYVVVSDGKSSKIALDRTLYTIINGVSERIPFSTEIKVQSASLESLKCLFQILYNGPEKSDRITGINSNFFRVMNKKSAQDDSKVKEQEEKFKRVLQKYCHLKALASSLFNEEISEIICWTLFDLVEEMLDRFVVERDVVHGANPFTGQPRTLSTHFFCDTWKRMMRVLSMLQSEDQLKTVYSWLFWNCQETSKKVAKKCPKEDLSMFQNVDLTQRYTIKRHSCGIPDFYLNMDYSDPSIIDVAFPFRRDLYDNSESEVIQKIMKDKKNFSLFISNKEKDMKNVDPIGQSMGIRFADKKLLKRMFGI